MHHHAFEEPVAVLIGLGFVREIGDVWEAYTFLNEWQPCARRKLSHAEALKACRAALSDAGVVETARSHFVEFARGNHLLGPEPVPAMYSPALAGDKRATA